MSILRIRCSILDAAQRCEWALIDDGREPVTGEGRLADLPERAERVQLVLPAEQVLITRARLPQAAKRHAESVLAFAVEEETLGDPEDNQVSWLGSAGDEEVLAVVDKKGLKCWTDALNEVGIPDFEVHSEALLLPLSAGEWSLAWNGQEGFMRTAQLEGAATDCGDRESPPLSLRLALDAARARNALPGSIALYVCKPDAAPDLEAWQSKLEVPLWPAGTWDWRRAPAGAGVSISQQRRHWRMHPGAFARLRTAAWVAGAALAIHALALIADWTLLAAEQRILRQQMEARFRTAFPEAVAVVDPALQMRRKLAETRRAVGRPDSGDFLPMIEQAAAAVKGLPAGSLRIVSYENGRLTLELAAIDSASVSRTVTRLIQAGLAVDAPPASKRPGSGAAVITVRAL